MTALITLSHGSRHPRAKEGIRALTEAAAGKLGVEWADAHLEFDRPTLAETAAVLDSTRAIVVPLLFTRAFHAKVDVPAHLAEARRHCDLTLAEPLGTGADITEVLHKRLLIDAPSAPHATLFSPSAHQIPNRRRTTPAWPMTWHVWPGSRCRWCKRRGATGGSSIGKRTCCRCLSPTELC